MNELENYEIAAIPEWALCYLEYGDTDGLTLEDIALANGFKADYCLVARCGEEHYFTRFPAFGALPPLKIGKSGSVPKPASLLNSNQQKETRI